MDSKTWDSLNCLLCSSIKYSKELSSFWKQVSALTLKSSPLVCHKKSSRNKTDKGKILDSPGQQTALPNHFTFGLCQILRFWFRNFQKTEEIPKMCCVSTPLFFPPMKQIGISSSSSPLLIHFRSTNAGLFFGNGWETRKSDQFVDKSGKAPFTQDAEVLANAACKKWNTLFPIGVFTQPANLRANLLTRSVWMKLHVAWQKWSLPNCAGWRQFCFFLATGCFGDPSRILHPVHPVFPSALRHLQLHWIRNR